MPVWLSLFVAVFGAVGFFAGLYAVVIGIVEAKRAKAKPRIGIASGSRPGTFVFWANWQPDTFALQVYRLRIALYNPNGEPKENVFTVSYDPVQKAPFLQEVEFPPTFLAVLDKQDPKLEGIVTVDFRTVEEFTLPVNYKLSFVRKVAKGNGPKAPKIANALPATAADPATVMTLDYSELVVRKKKLRDLEAAAKAKAAKAPPPKPQPAVAAAAAAPVAAAPAAAVQTAPKPAPAKEAAKPAPAAAPAKEAPKPAPAAAKEAAAPAKPAAKEAAPAASPRPETKLETAAKAGEIPSIRSVIKQANAKEKRPGEETPEVKPKSEG